MDYYDAPMVPCPPGWFVRWQDDGLEQPIAAWHQHSFQLHPVVGLNEDGPECIVCIRLDDQPDLDISQAVIHGPAQ